MSDTHANDTADDDRTDPSIALPESRPPSAPPASARPPSRSTVPPLPPRLSSLPPLPPSRPLSAAPSVRPGSVPPATMPRPSDPPPARGEAGVVQRQRLAQMEVQLDRARATIAQQREEIDALRAHVDAGYARLDELLSAVRDAAREHELERRIDELEQRQAAIASEERQPDARHDDELGDRVRQLDERLGVLEEGTAESRIRMRLERTGHRLEDLERRLIALEERQRATDARLADNGREDARRDERLARIESLFDELVEEVRQDRDALDLDGLRARIDDVEALVLRTGTEEEALRRKVGEQERALEALRESIVPPAAAAPAGDDLTQIKGIGPKYARLLKAMGVSSFAQVAGWSDEDVERAAAGLGVKASRVKAWVAAAARLADP